MINFASAPPRRTRRTRRLNPERPIGFFLRVLSVLCGGEFLVASLASLLCSAPVHAQKMTGSPAAAGYRQEPGQTSSTMPPALREIGFDQRLDQHVPLDTTFRDETGRTVRLRAYFGSPAVRVPFCSH